MTLQSTDLAALDSYRGYVVLNPDGTLRNEIYMKEEHALDSVANSVFGFAMKLDSRDELRRKAVLALGHRVVLIKLAPADA